MTISPVLVAAARDRAAAGRSFDPEPDVAVRGTVVLLPGRGEHAGVYQRFGRRLAFDGYAVRVLDEPSAAGLSGAVLAHLYAVAPRPLVLAGSDSGALRALAIAAAHVLVPDGLLLAGLVFDEVAAPAGRDWAGELDARTACPVHRDRLGRDTTLVRGALAAPVPVELADAARRLDPADIGAPVLFVHGAEDIVAPVAGVISLSVALPHAELVTVVGGRHDVLNDVHHRSVAAQIVQWLERLRSGGRILNA